MPGLPDHVLETRPRCWPFPASTMRHHGNASRRTAALPRSRLGLRLLPQPLLELHLDERRRSNLLLRAWRTSASRSARSSRTIRHSASVSSSYEDSCSTSMSTASKSAVPAEPNSSSRATPYSRHSSRIAVRCSSITSVPVAPAPSVCRHPTYLRLSHADSVEIRSRLLWRISAIAPRPPSLVAAALSPTSESASTGQLLWPAHGGPAFHGQPVPAAP